MFSRSKAIKQLEALKKGVKKMRLAAEDWPTEFQTLISIVLSARTRDEMTIWVCDKLFEKFPTSEELSKASIKEVEEIIRPVNFFQNKSKNIIECAKKVVKEFNSKLPHNIEKLITLPGVGRKTANVFLSEYGGDAIGVDTHLSYVSQKLGWTKNKNPEKIERDLQWIFPKSKWSELNPAAVRFGKSHTSKREKDVLLNKIREIR